MGSNPLALGPHSIGNNILGSLATPLAGDSALRYQEFLTYIRLLHANNRSLVHQASPTETRRDASVKYNQTSLEGRAVEIVARRLASQLPGHAPIPPHPAGRSVFGRKIPLPLSDQTLPTCPPSVQLHKHPVQAGNRSPYPSHSSSPQSETETSHPSDRELRVRFVPVMASDRDIRQARSDHIAEAQAEKEALREIVASHAERLEAIRRQARTLHLETDAAFKAAQDQQAERQQADLRQQRYLRDIDAQGNKVSRAEEREMFLERKRQLAASDQRQAERRPGDLATDRHQAKETGPQSEDRLSEERYQAERKRQLQRQRERYVARYSECQAAYLAAEEAALSRRRQILDQQTLDHEYRHADD